MMMIATDDNYFHFQFELYVHSTLQTRLCFVNVCQSIITILVQENFNKLNCMTSNYIMKLTQEIDLCGE